MECTTTALRFTFLGVRLKKGTDTAHVHRLNNFMHQAFE